MKDTEVAVSNTRIQQVRNRETSLTSRSEGRWGQFWRGGKFPTGGFLARTWGICDRWFWGLEDFHLTHPSSKLWLTLAFSCLATFLLWVDGSVSSPPRCCPNGSSRRTPGTPSSWPWVCTRASGCPVRLKVQARCSARSLTPCFPWIVSTKPQNTNRSVTLTGILNSRA